MRLKSYAIQLACLSLLLTGSGLAQAFSTGFPVLEDGNGQIVGPVIDRGAIDDAGTIDEYVDTVLYVDGVPYFLRAFANFGGLSSGLFHPGEAKFRVFFKDAACAGTPYIASQFNNFPTTFDIYAVVNDLVSQEVTIYRPQNGASLENNQDFDSSLDEGGCTPFLAPDRTAIKAEKVIAPFVAPFSVQRSSSLSLAALPFDIPTLNSPGQWLLLAALLLTGWFAGRRRRSTDRNA